jgi:hypothetical protein
MRTKLRSKVTLLFVMCAVLIAVPAVAAIADQLRDELTTATPTATITQNDPNGFVNTYHLDDTGQGPNVDGQCDVNAANPATFQINTPVGVTATPNTLTFTQCGTPTTNTQDVKFTASVANTSGYNITATQTSGANFPNDNIQTPNATFTLIVNPDTTKPTVTAVTPTGTSEPVGTNVTATFSEDMDPATLNDAEGDGNFTLKKTSDNSLVGAVVSYNATDKKATLNPNADLAYNTQYTATVGTGAKDLAGNGLDQDGAAGSQDAKTWTFTTEPPPNSAPVANSDSYNVNEDGTLTVNPPGVLGNDTDADGNPLTATQVGPGPSNASSFNFNPDGSFTYTPVANFFGVDTFTYKANDGTADSNVTTVTITVVPVNDPPTCQDVAIETDEDTQGSVEANCSDVEGDLLSYAIEDEPANGDATVDVSTLKYDPDPNFNGSDSFTYSASDGQASSAPANVAVTVNPVNDPPTTPGAITTNETLNNDGTFELNWADSEDVDGDSITYTLEKRDADDANWSQVASGLTSSSYTFGGSNPAEDEGTWDYRVKAVDSPAGAESDYSTAENLVKVDKSDPNAPTLSFATTGQSFKATVGGVDWYKDSAKIDVAANGDPALADTSDGSGVDAASFLATFSVTTNGTSTASKTVKDNATNESAAGTLQVHVDAADPTLGSCPTAGPFILNSGGGTQSVGPINASDGESGVDNGPGASTLSGSVNTSTVGEKTVTFTAKDNVGHEVTKQCTYSVIYNWDGFRQPVDNLPTLNTVKAGQSIPMKFSLSGNQGLSILQPSTTLLPNPKVTAITCPGGSTPMDAIEQTTTANNGLTYDATADQYNYVWKTQSTYVNKCYRFDMTLIDGTTHSALFKFSK